MSRCSSDQEPQYSIKMYTSTGDKGTDIMKTLSSYSSPNLDDFNEHLEKISYGVFKRCSQAALVLLVPHRMGCPQQ